MTGENDETSRESAQNRKMTQPDFTEKKDCATAVLIGIGLSLVGILMVLLGGRSSNK